MSTNKFYPSQPLEPQTHAEERSQRKIKKEMFLLILLIIKK